MAQGFEDHNSSLQLVKFDPASNAPEHDHAVTAPEVFELPNAPEQVVPRDPEVLYPNEAPIPLADFVSVHSQASNPAINKGLSRTSVRTILGIFLGIMIVSVGLGVGLGIKSKESTSSATPTISTLPSSTGTGIPQSSQSSILLPHGFLDDSSFAVAVGSDINRHVIFQDLSGAIRDAYYSQTTQSWTSTKSWVVPGKAKNHTPFSAIVQTFANSSQQGIHLFYIDAFNKLATSLFASGVWFDDSRYDIGNLASFTTARNSRTLAVTPISHVSGTQYNETVGFRVYLAYESANGAVSMLLGEQIDLGYSNFSEQSQLSWTWQDITAGFNRSSPGTTFAPPFGFSNIQVEGPGITTPTIFETIQIHLFNKHNYSDYFSIGCYPDNNYFSRPILGSSGLEWWGDIHILDQTLSANETALIQASDLFIPKVAWGFTLWVKQNQLMMDGYVADSMVPTGVPAQKPASPFPFARFAAVNSSAFYLYHQINSTVFAEDVWDSGALSWVSSKNISISTWT